MQKSKQLSPSGILINGVFLANDGSINLPHDKAKKMRLSKNVRSVANGLQSYKKQIDTYNSKKPQK